MKDGFNGAVVNESKRAFALIVRWLAADGVREPDPIAVPAPEPEPTPEPGPAYAASVPETICSYAWPCATALRVAECESNDDPGAYNRSSGASGLFQLIPYWHAWRLRAGETLFQAAANIRIAFEVYVDAGYSWQPWASSQGCWG